MGLWDWLTGRVTEDKFAAMMIDAMRQAGLEEPVEYEEESFALVVGGDRKIFLGNAFEEYQSAPSDVRHQVIEHYAFGVFIPPEELTPGSFEQAAPNLLPAIRGRMYIQYMRMQSEIDDDPYIDVPHRVVGEHFVEIPAWDMPNRILHLPVSQFEDWGVSLDEVFETARENLRAIGGDFEGTEGRLYVGAWDDSYAASRVVVPEMIHRLPVRGRPVVAIPNRNLLIVAGSNDDEALQRMGEMITEAEGEPRFESGIVLSLEDEGWRPFLPAQDSEARDLLHRHQVASFWRDYDEHKRLLDDLHEKRGTAIHVAEFMAHEDRYTKSLSTSCVWPEGVEALLPRTDEVLLSTGDSDEADIIGSAPWQRVMEVAGELMERTDHYPERWRVRRFPSPDQRDAMDLDEGPSR